MEGAGVDTRGCFGRRLECSNRKHCLAGNRAPTHPTPVRTEAVHSQPAQCTAYVTPAAGERLSTRPAAFSTSGGTLRNTSFRLVQMRRALPYGPPRENLFRGGQYINKTPPLLSAPSPVAFLRQLPRRTTAVYPQPHYPGTAEDTLRTTPPSPSASWHRTTAGGSAACVNDSGEDGSCLPLPRALQHRCVLT